MEFAEKESVTKALQLSGMTFMSQPIIIQLTQAEKNRVVNTRYGILQFRYIRLTFIYSSSTTAAASGPTRLYVGSLHFNISEDDLQTVFAPFGEIEFINLHMDPETGRSKGFGFVQYVFFFLLSLRSSANTILDSEIHRMPSELCIR